MHPFLSLANIGKQCENLEWSPIKSAPAHSTLAGVLAGLVFAGIIVLLTDRRKDHAKAEERTRAMTLLLAAFVVMAFDSFLFGAVSGEQVCLRGWTRTMLSAGLLGLGTVGIFTGISWAFHAYDDASGIATRLSVVNAYVVAFVTSYHLYVTASGYLNDIRALGLRVSPHLESLVRGYPWAAAGLIVSLLVWRHVAKQGAAKRRSQHSMADRLNRAVTYAAYSAIFYVVITGSIPATLFVEWEEASTAQAGTLAFALSVSLVMPTLALIMQLQALPHVARSVRIDCLPCRFLVLQP